MLALGIYAIPIFLINLVLPAVPESSLDLAIDQFLDEQLFGLIGFWSSFFPYSSKATANYIAVSGPLLAIVSMRHSFIEKFDSRKFDQMTLKRYLGMLLSGLILSALFIWFFYLTSTDLGTAEGKYGNLFGLNIVFFSIHNAALSFFLFLLVPIFIHRCLYYIPCQNIKKWIARRKEPRESRKKFRRVAKLYFFSRLIRNSPMQMTTALLIVNPCDDEEDNMAMLCCHSDKGEMFLMSRYPDEDELEITLDGEPSTLEGVKVTLSSNLLKIEIAAADADALNGDDVLEISFNPDMVDMDEVVETLKNILDGTGTFISQI